MLLAKKYNKVIVYDVKNKVYNEINITMYNNNNVYEFINDIHQV